MGKRGALAASPRATRRNETSGTIQDPARVWTTTARPAGCTAAFTDSPLVLLVIGRNRR
ncbi:MAG: hypothetical protein ACOX0O_12645 [Candidatus Methanoculleus thermohydrogenotrophicum]